MIKVRTLQIIVDDPVLEKLKIIKIKNGIKNWTEFIERLSKKKNLKL